MEPALPQTPSFRLEGRRALVTGAGRGLGAACAAALADAGAAVTLVARSGDEIAEVAAALRARGGRAETLVLDVTDLAAVEATLTEPFDILVNNAGTNRPGPFVAVTAEDYDAVLGLNMRASFFVTQAVVKALVAAGRPGSIINMSSQMGHVGAAQRSIYCASKHAVEGFTKALAVELGPHGIRVNSICPTFIETPLTQPYFEDAAFRAQTLGKIKLGRLGQPEDIMGAVLLLASDASSLMTGSSLLIDGGWTAD